MFQAKIHVLTVSDRAHAGQYEDTAGPAACALLRNSFPEADISSTIIPDGIESITSGVNKARTQGARIILTLGGTGIAPRDVTPEASAQLISRDLPGISEAIRREGQKSTERAVVSRGLAGVINANPSEGFASDCVLINLAGSLNAAEVGTKVVIPLLDHLIMQLDGDKHNDSH